jgi:hypothetical protein
MLSSERYKEHIKPMDTRTSNNILLLEPITFIYKGDEEQKLQYGLSAEETVKHCPDIVICNDEGLVETVEYHTLPILLLNKVKQQNDILTQLMLDVATLKIQLQQYKQNAGNNDNNNPDNDAS